MAGQRSKRRSRKRRRSASAPRAVPSQRREHRPEPEVRAGAQAQPAERGRTSRLDRRGERPPGLFGGIPVSEIAIFAGLVAVIVGYFDHGGPALIGGIVLCGLGVIEVTAREHFAGFRSHTILLAALPTVGVEFLLVQVMPTSWPRETALIGDVIVFSALFWPLRSRFLRARQARIARPPRA
jgi:type IV secretory pathway TrbD component